MFYPSALIIAARKVKDLFCVQPALHVSVISSLETTSCSQFDAQDLNHNFFFLAVNSATGEEEERKDGDGIWRGSRAKL